MRLKPALKYQFSSIKWAVITYYIVVYALLIAMAATITFSSGRSIFTFGGLDGATMIFLFVAGLNAFKSTFHMLSANSISRRTMFISFVTSAAVICAGMALIDSINAFIIRQFVDYQPTLAQTFGARYAGGGFMMYLDGLFWMFFSYLSSIMLGYFVTTAYYRMNKPLKLIISIGVPVFIFIIMPILDASLFDGGIFKAIGTFFQFTSGQTSGSPYVGMASDLVFAAISGGLAYLLARRATVKLQPA